MRTPNKTKYTHTRTHPVKSPHWSLEPDHMLLKRYNCIAQYIPFVSVSQADPIRSKKNRDCSAFPVQTAHRYTILSQSRLLSTVWGGAPEPTLANRIRFHKPRLNQGLLACRLEQGFHRGRYLLQTHVALFMSDRVQK